MAGSYNHAVTDRGNLRSPESFSGMIENLSDAYEMAEEMFGMIWWLAQDKPNAKMAVEEARQKYRDGIGAAERINREQR